MTPDVSVIIPTYNGALFIREALESVFTQTLSPKEIIVVDDCSSDGTADLVESIIPQSSLPLRVIRLQKNSGGPAHPMNVGIAAASGELISILDQDDVFLPDKLKDQVDVYSRAPQLSFCFALSGSYEEPNRINQNDSFLRELISQAKDCGDYREIPGSFAFELFMWHGQYLGGYPAFIFPRKYWERKGGLDEMLRIGSDYDFACWLSLQGDIGFISTVCYLRRHHSYNMCRQTVEAYLDGGRIKARYVARKPQILQRSDLSEKLRGEIFGLSYWLRESRYYREAFYYLLFSVRVWGCRRDVVWYALKLLSHMLLSKVRKLGGVSDRVANLEVNKVSSVPTFCESNRTDVGSGKR